MDYNKLQTFTVVAECQSVSRAAEILYRTQPAISNQLKDLEASLGMVLFERKHGRIFLTPEGELLQMEAVRHLRAIEDTVHRLKDDRRNTAGTIRIATQFDSVGVILPSMIKLFRQQYPKVRFEVHPASFGEGEAMLLTNKADFSFQVVFEKRDFFDVQRAFDIRRVLVASEEYLENSPTIEKVDDLLQHQLVMFFSPMGDLRMWLKKNGLSALVSQFEKSPADFVVRDAFTVNEMVRAGLGVGFVFCGLTAGRDFAAHKLKPVLGQYDSMTGGVDIAYRKVRNESYINQAFREFVVANRQQWDQLSNPGLSMR